MFRFPAIPRHFFAAMICTAVLLMAGTAPAQKFLENYKVPMPEIPLMAQPDFEATTQAFTETPFNDKALAYTIRMPKDWAKQRDVSLSNSKIGNKILGELVRFYGPPQLGERSYMNIQALKLDYQLTAEQWFIQYLLANSYTVQGIKTYDDNRVEALYVYVVRDVTYVVRAMVQLNGTRAVLAQYYVPAENWEAEKQLQAQCIGSFNLLNKVEEVIEQMENYHFLDIAEVAHPISWETKSDKLMSIDRMAVTFLNVASKEKKKNVNYKLLNGKISVQLVSYHDMVSIAEEINRYKADIRKSGMLIGDFLETKEDFKLQPAMTAVPAEVYEATDTGNEGLGYELWFLLMESGDYYYFVTLLTPSRDEDYFLWSRNTQTFRVIARTITPQVGSLTGN
jgi:hypothetical protein